MNKKTEDNSASLMMELQVLTNTFATLKTSGAASSTLQAVEDLINKKLSQVQ